jgi:hypothetical protein
LEYQTSLTQGQPDDEAVRLLQYYEALALENDPRGYCVCTSEGKDSRVLGHLFRRAGGLFLFGLHAIRRGFLVLLDGRGLFFGNLFPRARGFVFCILLRRALACACVFSLFAHA